MSAPPFCLRPFSTLCVSASSSLGVLFDGLTHLREYDFRLRDAYGRQAG
jgi:hypothetical protein